MNRDCTITLDYAARYFRRKVVTADDGRRILIDLPDAVFFADGDPVIATDGTMVVIRAAPEALFEVTGDDLARFAWHIGNRHTPCEILPARLLIQRDHVLEDMLLILGATVTPVERPFQPEGGAYGHGRTHGHGHSHDPQVDPDAHLHARD